MRKKDWIIPTRWLEVADSPAAAAIILFAMLTSIGVGSCTSSSTNSPALRPTRTDSPPGTATRPAEQREPILRVRLLSDVREVVLSGPRSITIAPDDRPSGAKSITTPIKVMRLETGWLLRDGSGAPVAFANPAIGAPPLVLKVAADKSGAHIRINDAPYPGEFTLRPKSDRPAPPAAPPPAFGTTGAPPSPERVSPVLPFDLIEHIGIESYLPGVISRELLPNWSLNAFKAQAIAARTYAMHERERSTRNNEPYDLESSQLDQVYGGAVDHAVANRATAETRGLVLMTEGRLLRAYYSSTCGGRPAAAKDVWPTTKGFEFNLDGPIQGTQGPDTACSFSPRTRWTVTRTRDELSKRLSAFGRDQGLAVRGLRSITRVEPTTKTAEGRPTNYRIFDADGKWFALSAEQLRTGCNWIGTSGQPPVTAQTRVLSGDAEFAVQGASVIITGRGFGHGVGLCQYGAEGMSRAGATAEQIVLHYYPGATLMKAY
ncbi:MAG: SpoIID/LytB domain-containing protein [Phycisphaerae bacterium]|nr:SpoIID/LytB domain-containing protein [Phycisphaerae bacterium]